MSADAEPDRCELKGSNMHQHNAFLCPAHVRGCSCPSVEGFTCNPYREIDYCPDDIDYMPDPND